MSIKRADRPEVGWGETLADIREFAASDWDCAEVELHGRDSGHVYRLYRQTCSRHRDEATGISVSVRKGHVYLVKEVS